MQASAATWHWHTKIVHRVCCRADEMPICGNISDQDVWRTETSRNSRICLAQCSLPYSALAFLRIGMLGSASFQNVRNSSYALFALALSPDEVYALPSCKCASTPMGSKPTIPRWS